MSARLEKDLLGERSVPAGVLHGIHTERAIENFPLALRPVRPCLIHAYGAVKLACARTNHELGRWDAPTFAAVERACREMMEGQLDEHIVVDALQGGAGTSMNMNVNEVLTNRALVLLGRPIGDYDTLSALDDLNLHQSTNDTFPTALRVAALLECQGLERDVLALQEAFQAKERELAGVRKMGRTEMQDAVPITLGQEMGAYAEAFARDRWRVYKCEERLRVVNLGGTAIGTGLGAPRSYVFRVVEHLREVTGLPVARAENLIEATQNADVFVEVSGILKACAASLLKVASDLRVLSSGPDGGIHEIALPARQAGSSLMPGKVNPVIPEAVSQVALVVFGNDQTIAVAAGLGHLELNPFLPLVADALLGSIGLLARACSVLRRHAVEGLSADHDRCRAALHSDTARATGLVEALGYGAVQAAFAVAQATGRPLRDVLVEQGTIDSARLDELWSAGGTTMLGSRGRP
jgi:aspartate ammonia-lyase